MLDESGNRPEFKTEEQLAHESRPLSNDITTPDHPSDKAVAEYIANLSPIWRRHRDNLCVLGWTDESIQNFLTLPQNNRKLSFARIRMAGKSEDEIERLGTLCDEVTKDYSYMKRPFANRAEEDGETQLYLLEEVARQRVIFGK